MGMMFGGWTREEEQDERDRQDRKFKPVIDRYEDNKRKELEADRIGMEKSIGGFSDD